MRSLVGSLVGGGGGFLMGTLTGLADGEFLLASAALDGRTGDPLGGGPKMLELALLPLLSKRGTWHLNDSVLGRFLGDLSAGTGAGISSDWLSHLIAEGLFT